MRAKEFGCRCRFWASILGQTIDGRGEIAMTRHMVRWAGAVALLVTVSIDAQAQATCSSFFNQCSARCVNNAKGHTQAKCTADHCRPKLATCQRTGCWTEGAAFGGGKTCNLKK
jgi:hypothetical protein